MTAYVVVDLDITDPEGFQEYARQVVPMIVGAGGRPVAADSDVLVLEGEWTPARVVIYEFADREAAQRFWDSPEYQPLKELRRKYSTAKVVVAESPSPQPPN